MADETLNPEVIEALDNAAKVVLSAAKTIAYDAENPATTFVVDPLDLISTGPNLDPARVVALKESIAEGDLKYAEFRDAKENAKVIGNIAIELLDVIKKIVPMIGLMAI